MSHFQTLWNLRNSTLEPEPSSLFWLLTSVDVASDRPASWSVDSTSLFLAKNCVWRFCFLLEHRGHLQALKVRELKLLCLSQLWVLKYRISMSEFKLKNTKMFWKYQFAVWLSIQIFYSYFTKVTRKCKCFGRIVKPCFPLPTFFIFLQRYLVIPLKCRRIFKKGNNSLKTCLTKLS